MKLEDIVTTYEQSKRIQELQKIEPIKTGCLFYRGYWYGKWELHTVDDVRERGENVIGPRDSVVPAYTAEELAQILPLTIEDDRGDDCWLTIDHVEDGSRMCAYYGDGFFCSSAGINLAQAMGDMLIYLLEHALLPKK